MMHRKNCKEHREFTYFQEKMSIEKKDRIIPLSEKISLTFDENHSI